MLGDGPLPALALSAAPPGSAAIIPLKARQSVRPSPPALCPPQRAGLCWFWNRPVPLHCLGRGTPQPPIHPALFYTAPEHLPLGAEDTQ